MEVLLDFLQLARYFKGFGDRGAYIAHGFAVADLKDLYARVHELLVHALIGLEADAEHHVVRRQRHAHSVLALNHGALVVDADYLVSGFYVNLIVGEQIAQHHIDGLRHSRAGGEYVVQRLDEGENELKSMSDPLSGTVRMGFFYCVANSEIPKIFRQFYEDNPNCIVELELDNPMNWRDLYLHWPQNRKLTKAAEFVRDYIVSATDTSELIEG